MAKKWANFHSSHNPIDVTINTGDSNVVADWSRLNWDETFIDGKQLSTWMSAYSFNRDSLDTEQLKYFFTKVLLNGLPESKREQALDYLMISFHQGGLLHPVSSAMYTLFEKDKIGAAAVGSPKQVNIVTEEDGFTLQEIYTVKKFLIAPNAPAELNERYEDNIILPDEGHSFCLKAQATLKVSFGEEEQPTIDVSNKSISYGNEFVQSLADMRKWYDKFIDFIKNMFKANSVPDLSFAKEKECIVLGDNKDNEPKKHKMM